MVIHNYDPVNYSQVSRDGTVVIRSVCVCGKAIKNIPYVSLMCKTCTNVFTRAMGTNVSSLTSKTSRYAKVLLKCEDIRDTDSRAHLILRCIYSSIKNCTNPMPIYCKATDGVDERVLPLVIVPVSDAPILITNRIYYDVHADVYISDKGLTNEHILDAVKHINELSMDNPLFTGNTSDSSNKIRRSVSSSRAPQIRSVYSNAIANAPSMLNLRNSTSDVNTIGTGTMLSLRTAPSNIPSLSSASNPMVQPSLLTTSMLNTSKATHTRVYRDPNRVLTPYTQHEPISNHHHSKQYNHMSDQLVNSMNTLSVSTSAEQAHVQTLTTTKSIRIDDMLRSIHSDSSDTDDDSVTSGTVKTTNVIASDDADVATSLHTVVDIDSISVNDSTDSDSCTHDGIHGSTISKLSNSIDGANDDSIECTDTNIVDDSVCVKGDIDTSTKLSNDHEVSSVNSITGDTNDNDDTVDSDSDKSIDGTI